MNNFVAVEVIHALGNLLSPIDYVVNAHWRVVVEELEEGAVRAVLHEYGIPRPIDGNPTVIGRR